MPTIGHVTWQLDGCIAIVTISHPPVNTLCLEVRIGLLAAIERSFQDPVVKVLIIIGEGSTFVAGADINEFGKPYGFPSLYVILDLIMSGTKPVIAALHGNALGGGLELALACQWRIANPTALLGQPEVKLGLMPGGGGTQWLTRMAGPEVALEVCTSGMPISAVQALNCGVVDRIVESDLLNGALVFAHEVATGLLPVRDLHLATDKIRHIDANFFSQYRLRHQEVWRGLLAPWKIIDCIEAACTMSFTDGFAMERQAFQACEAGPQSRAMIHLFFAHRTRQKSRKITVSAGHGQPELRVGFRLREVFCRESSFLLGEGISPGFIAHCLRQFGFNSDLPELIMHLQFDFIPLHQPLPTRLTESDILQHLLYMMAIEGACLLDQQLIYCAGDIDVVSVTELGFPAYRGGIMYWMQETGEQAMQASLNSLLARHAGRWQAPAMPNFFNRL